MCTGTPAPDGRAGQRLMQRLLLRRHLHLPALVVWGSQLLQGATKATPPTFPALHRPTFPCRCMHACRYGPGFSYSECMEFESPLMAAGVSAFMALATGLGLLARTPLKPLVNR